VNPRIARLSLLYFVQGLPIGIQFGILPILMRERGASRTEIAYAGAVALPWMIKVLWAPIVDSLHIASVGRRRTWILPLQLVMVASLLALAHFHSSESLAPLYVSLAVLNFAAATMDIAVDGLAVDWLSDAELGPGNAAQVGGFKLGMLFAGGASLQLLHFGSYRLVFGAMAAIALVAFLSTLFFREPAHFVVDPVERVGARDLVRMFSRLFLDPSTRWLVLVVLLYKAGETMADSQWKPFLVDSGFSAADIGLYIGLAGMAFSALGSFVAGSIGARSRSLVDALFVIAAIRILPIIGEAVVAQLHPAKSVIIAVSLFENLGGGLLTTLIYALMMSSADPERAGTSFTLLATVDTVGRSLMTFVAGVLADRAGDVVVFSCAAALSVAFLALYPKVREHESRGAYRRVELVSSRVAPDPLV